jgi:hypothetical protein
MFLHQALHHSEIYNFTLDHDYKFKIIITCKRTFEHKIQKGICILFFECFEHMDPFLWSI